MDENIAIAREAPMIDSKNLKLTKNEFYLNIQKAIQETLRSRYFYAMLIYLIYAIAMVVNNHVGSVDEANSIYFYFAIVHVVDAFLFLWALDDTSYTNVETWPEYLNIAGSILYLWSSTTYDDVNDVSNYNGVLISDVYYRCRLLELIASILEVFAAIGWILVWYKNLIERFGSNLNSTPNRGLSFFDPDLHACWTILVGALLYLFYNIDLSRDPRKFDESNIYAIGDIFYLVNSIAYMVATLRDFGWFWFAPTLCTALYEDNEELTPLSPKIP
jgi:hypothetical protein